MISEDKFGLRPIWDACLEIYKEIAKICDKHGLRYYATDGTALGAVRHKGYIPWDDDFDISMPRPDYEKFKEIAAKELPPHLKFWDRHDESKFIYLFGKVQIVKEDLVRNLEKRFGQTLSNGMFVDIFPIDGYPESSMERLWICISTGIMKCIVRFRCTRYKDQTSLGRKAWIAGMFLSLLLPWMTQRRCLSYCERILKRHPFEASSTTGRTCSSVNVFRRAPLCTKAWGRPTPYEFEGTTIMLPEDADAHLRNEYYKWDYMQLPPEKDRHPTHSVSSHFPWWLGPTNG